MGTASSTNSTSGGGGGGGGASMPKGPELPPTVVSPEPFDELSPGLGATITNKTVYNPLVGDYRPKIECVQDPSAGWDQRLQEHVQSYCSKRHVLWTNDPIQKVEALRPDDTERLTAEYMRATTTRACRELLAAWPRGDGPGELLHDPLIDTTPPRERGVMEEWWAAVCSRAPFVPTRIFVEAFVKPVTKASCCALWFFIPPQFRANPTPPNGVFISHAWDLGM